MKSSEAGVTRVPWLLPLGRSRVVLAEMPMIYLGMFGSSSLELAVRVALFGGSLKISG